MYLTITLHPLLWYSIGTLFFYLAIQQPRSLLRLLLSTLHALSMMIPLSPWHDMSRIENCFIVAPFLLYSTIHTVSMLYMDGRVLQLNSTPLVQRLREVFRLWSNIRGIRLAEGTNCDSRTTRTRFAMRRLCHSGAMWLIYHFFGELSVRALRGLNVSIRDFMLPSQSILPQMKSRDLCIRAVMSVNWIWSSYVLLSGAHDLSATFFVSLLGWDQPQEWPPLFGRLVDAYSLRRFWGYFWHQLHTNLYERFIPFSLQSTRTPRKKRLGLVCKAFRAFWMFFLSAICHAFVNWVMLKNANIIPEMRFFLVNYAVCLVETVGKGTSWAKLEPGWWTTRIIGYAWVLFIFICLVPGWRYPLILDAAYKL